MSRTTVTRQIAAPVGKVFDTVAQIENFSKAVPGITNVELLSERTSGVGTRFRETRMMGRRKAITELEVTEYVENQDVRLVSDQGGTIWDTVFTTRPDGAETKLTMVMDARPYKISARIINPMIRRMITKAIEADLDAVKEYCESA